MGPQDTPSDWDILEFMGFCKKYLNGEYSDDDDDGGGGGHDQSFFHFRVSSFSLKAI